MRKKSTHRLQCGGASTNVKVKRQKTLRKGDQKGTAGAVGGKSGQILDVKNSFLKKETGEHCSTFLEPKCDKDQYVII